MADIETAHSIGSDKPVATVATKSIMVVATAWTARPFLYCDSLTRKVNGFDTARLRYTFGPEVLQRGGTTYDSYPPLDLVGQFVRVTVGAYNWYGYIVGEDKDREADPSTGALTGRDQVWKAVGLAYFLSRAPIRSAVIHDEVEIGRGLTFNGGDGGRLLDYDAKGRANMHPADDSSGITGMRGFHDPQDTSDPPELWSATNILDHVLYYHGPKDVGGTRRPTWYVRGSGVAPFLDDWYPTVRTDNHTVMEVLNTLASPKRGLCWWLEYEDDDTFHSTGSIYVYVNSLTPTLIALNQGSGGELPANTNQKSLDFDADAQVARSVIGKPDGRAWRRVVCRGARQTGTGTFGMADANLEKNWSTISEVAYEVAASLSDGYADLPSDDKRRQRNDAVRRAESLSDVFSSFIIPDDWTGKVGDGSGAIDEVDRAALFPVLTGSSPSGQRAHYWPGLRALPTLACSWDGSVPAAGQEERLLGLLTVATSPTRSQLVDKLNHANFAIGTQVYDETPASYHVRPEDDVCGVRVQSRQLPHTMALGHFAGAALSGVDEQLDYDTLRVTVTIEADWHCEGYWPTPPSNVAIEEFVIDMGDQYRLDYLAPNTVLDVGEGADVYATPYSDGTVEVTEVDFLEYLVTLTDGTWPSWAGDGVIRIGGYNFSVLSRDSDTEITISSTGPEMDPGTAYEISNPSGAVIRDDRDLLTDFARFAYEWYSADRRELQLSFNRVDVTNFGLGMMITTVGSGTGLETINTVIGSITHDLASGRTTIATIGDRLPPPDLLS